VCVSQCVFVSLSVCVTFSVYVCLSVCLCVAHNSRGGLGIAMSVALMEHDFL